MDNNIASTLHFDDYRILFESIDEGINVIEKVATGPNERIDFRYILTNPAFEKITGLTDVIGKTVIEVWPGVNDSTMQVYENILKTGQSVRFETYEKTLGRWFSVYAFPIDEPALKRIAIILNDISVIKKSEEIRLREGVARKEYLSRAEEALRESERKYRDLFDSIDEGFCIIEVLFDDNDRPLDYRFLEVNQAFERQTGLVDAAGRCMRDTVPDHEQHWFDIYGRIALTGEPERFQDPAKALGHFYDVYAFRVGKPEQRRVAILFNDIHARKQAEDALRESEGRLRALTVASTNVVYRMSPDWSSMTELYGKGFLADTEEPNLNWLDKYIHPYDQEFVAGVINECIREKKMFELEHRVLQEDGSVGWTHSRAVPLQDGNGGIKEWGGAASDITERKRAEEALRKRTEREAFLLKLSDALRPLSDTLEIQGAVTRTVMDYFSADRCYYCEIEDDNAVIRQDASVGDLSSLVGVYPLRMFPNKAFIDAGRPIMVTDVHTTELMDEDLRQLCIQMQVISYLDVPVIRCGKPVGILCVTQCSPRNWTDSEVKLAVDIAERTWAVVERARAEAELKKARDYLEEKVAERTRELSQERQRLLDVLETLPVNICLLAPDYTLPFTNRAFQERFGEPKGRLCY
jgi:PAS domain S-box-containing protein